jgi:hypothetical protein
MTDEVQDVQEEQAPEAEAATDTATDEMDDQPMAGSTEGAEDMEAAEDTEGEADESSESDQGEDADSEGSEEV